MPGLLDIYRAHDVANLRINVAARGVGVWAMFGGQPDLHLTEDHIARIRARFAYDHA